MWGQVRASSDEKKALIARYKALVSSEGTKADAALGRQIFMKTCQRCHVLFGEGKTLGPDLTGSNRANLDYLLENIVDPSAVMAKEYRQSVFLTLDGRIVAGIVKEETENAITLQTAEATVVIPREDVDDRHDSELSMMPDNQLTQFSEHEMRSLFKYLRGTRQVPLPSH